MVIVNIYLPCLLEGVNGGGVEVGAEVVGVVGEVVWVVVANVVVVGDGGDWVGGASH